MILQAGMYIFALTDSIVGHTNQTLAVVEALGESPHPVFLESSPLNTLPAGIPFPVRFRYSAESWIEFEKTLEDISRQNVEKPLIIATGRRLAPAALYAKKSLNGVGVQIMDPVFQRRQFDLIAAPHHDNPPPLSNIFPILTPPHRLSAAALADESLRWGSRLKGDKPLMGVIIGGNYKGGVMTPALAEKFATNINAAARQWGADIALVTSRRTPAPVHDVFTSLLSPLRLVYRWGDTNENPYLGVLALSDILAITGESISMLTEGLATGKPLAVLDDPRFIRGKHRRFLQMLYDQKLACAMGTEIAPPARPLEPTANRIADTIRKNFY